MRGFRQRWFLEPASRSVDSYVVIEDDEPRRSVYTTEIILKIADCDRNVKLYFPVGNAKNKAISRRKLARLQKALDVLAERIEL